MDGWPARYSERLSGSSCPLCEEGRPVETPDRILFFADECYDAYLSLRGVQRGYAVVIWRGAHVVEPTDLSEDDASLFWLGVLRVARAMRIYFRPLKMNYQILGNGQPHLHCLVAPRFWKDIAPGKPLPAIGYKDFSESEVRRDGRALHGILTSEEYGVCRARRTE